VDVQMQPGDMVGVFRTLGTVGALQQFTNDKRQLHAAIDRIRYSVTNRVSDPQLDFARDAVYVFATFDAVQSLARALKSLPGRKSLVLFSESLRTVPDIRAVQDATEYQATADGFEALVRNVADAASRSGVVIYAIDPRGLPTLSLTGAESMSAEAVALKLTQTRKDYIASQSGMLMLAHETGGSYAGFTATADAQTLTVAPAGRAESMLTALLSPFRAPDIPLGMTATFYQDPKESLFLHTVVHIDASGVTFQDAGGGARNAELEMATFMFGEQGREIDRNAWISTARLSADEYKTALANGFLQTFSIPVKKPGAFQLRVAVRDKVSGKVGSVGQFVDVPRIGKDRLALSGIRLERAGAASDSHRESVLRVFHTGGTVTYGYQVLNATLDPASRKPQLEADLRMYRDGKPFWEHKAPIDSGNQADMAHLLAGGNFRVGASLTPGDYVMEVAVTDKLARGSARTATQSIDFQVAP
jgi:hypothetical protein